VGSFGLRSERVFGTVSVAPTGLRRVFGAAFPGLRLRGLAAGLSWAILLRSLRELLAGAGIKLWAGLLALHALC
jgi:hypothetical protein